MEKKQTETTIYLVGEQKKKDRRSVSMMQRESQGEFDSYPLGEENKLTLKGAVFLSLMALAVGYLTAPKKEDAGCAVSIKGNNNTVIMQGVEIPPCEIPSPARKAPKP